MTYFRVLVTGSRTWTDVEHVHGALNALGASSAKAGFDGLTVVHGAARGLDTIAAKWAWDRQRTGWPVTAEAHPADWKKYGRRAGFVRNNHMVSLGADGCFAWILDGSRGATQCADLAEDAGIAVVRFARRTDAAILPDSEVEA